MTGIDVRISRLEQGLVTVILLGGFVFGVPWTIPVAALIVAGDAALGSSGPVPRLWHGVIAARVKAATTFEEPGAARAQSLVTLAALVVATLLLLVDATGLAGVLAVVVAASSALATVGLFCAGCELYRRRNG